MNSLEKAIVLIASLIAAVYIAALLVLRIDNIIFGTVIASLVALAERLISKEIENRRRRKGGERA